MPRRGLLVITQTAMMILAFILAALAFLGLGQPWHIVALAFLLGVANAFDAPARQAFVLEMVERKDLTNGIALNSTMFNSATAVGPAFAGVTYALFGPAWCFTLNGISFVAVIAALLLMKLRPQAAEPRSASSVDDLKEGLRYVIATPIIRRLIGMVAATSLFGLAFATLLPAWAVTILGAMPRRTVCCSRRAAAEIGPRQTQIRRLAVGLGVMMVTVAALFAWLRAPSAG